MKISLLVAILLLSTKTWAVDPLSIKSCKVLEQEMKGSLQKMLAIKDSIFELASNPDKFAKAEIEMQVLASKNAVLESKKKQLKCKFTLEVDANGVIKSVKESKEKIEAAEAETRRGLVNSLCSYCSGTKYNLEFSFGRDICEADGCTFKHSEAAHYVSPGSLYDMDEKYNTRYAETLVTEFCKKKTCSADTKAMSDSEIKVIIDDFNKQLNVERNKAIDISYLKHYRAKLKTLRCSDEKEKCFKKVEAEEKDCQCFKDIDAMDYQTALKEYGAYAKKVLEKRYPIGEIPDGDKKVKIVSLSDGDLIYQYEQLK